MPEYIRPKYDYQPADKYIVFNDDDRDLTPVTLRLPDPPPLEYIDGYGLPPEEQKWRRLEIPPRLRAIEKKSLSILQHDHLKNSREKPNGYKQQKIFWSILEENAETYKEEINFIGKIQWYLTYGYWFFNFGKPTWIPPWYFRYLMFWSFPKGERPQYRDLDRRIEIWAWYNYTCTETFENIDESGNAIPDDDGNYKMVDINIRTSFGIQNPKRRRRGDTNRGLNKLVYIAYRNRRIETTIVSDTGEHAESSFKKMLLPSLRDEPIWIKPLWEGSYETDRILLRPPGNIYFDDFLDSSITYTKASTERANDSKQLFGLIEDEKGKGAVRADTTNRWEINRMTLHQGPYIHGYSEHPSTVEEMENGADYQNMWKDSNFYIRDKITGWTKSGVTRVYFHSWDGLDGFIDPWGYSVIDEPTEIQLKYAPPDAAYAKLKMGAKKYITEPLLKLRHSPDSSDQKLYRLRVKKTPTCSSDMWMGAINDLGFDYLLLNKRKIELTKEPQSKRVNFLWEGGIKDTKVIYEENVNGRWVVADIEKWAQISNQVTLSPIPLWNEEKMRYEHQRMPAILTLTTAGADPYGMSGDPNKKKSYRGKLSDGGGAVIENHDPTIDGDSDPRNWKTKNLICYYQNRRMSVYDYFEDMLMMCVFFNSPCAFERNKEELWAYFVRRGYGSYAKYAQKADGTFESKPGFYAGEKNKEQLFIESVNFINTRGHACKIKEYIIDCLDIKGYEDLTNKDGFAAVGWALLGSKSAFGKSIDNFRKNSVDWEKIIYSAPYQY